MDSSLVKGFADIIDMGADALGDRDMLIMGDERLTWNDMQARAGQVANALAAEGIGTQDRVAFIDKNSIEYFELAFGAAYRNAVTVAVNWRLAPPEMAYIVNDSQATVLVIHEEFAEQLTTFEDELEHIKRIVVIGAAGNHVSFGDWRDAHGSHCEKIANGDEDVCSQLYTSGTTGLPKGAQTTNANFQALFATVDWDMDEASRNLCVMPLFHIAGSGWALFGMANGATTVMMREFDPVAGLQIVESEATTHAIFVPAILQFFLMVPSDGIDLSSMQYIAYGASPITEDVLVKSMEQFGCKYFQVYGMTETTGAGTTLPPEDHGSGADPKLLRSAGKPIRGMEMKIIDADTGEELPDGEVGEVWMRHGGNMKGYWNMPEETAKAMPGDGWLRSGDAAYMEDGYLYIYDRVKDMIISGGENVYPAEIENALMGHAGIADVAVIGVPDERWGEVGKALVIPVADSGVTADEIMAHARERLAGFKCPKTVDFVEAIPRNASGKILKRELRDPFWEGHDRRVG
jgi:long-chain acyl-CoA synthetase